MSDKKGNYFCFLIIKRRKYNILNFYFHNDLLLTFFNEL